ncbi:PAS domain-containing protein [Pseudoroseicyclus sp. H15]
MNDQPSAMGSEEIDQAPFSIVMTNPNLDDDPITYVNDAFQRMTLYSRAFALGRNCRFLQGDQTQPEEVEALREGLRRGEEFQTTITNHKADGTVFRNQLLIAPIKGADGEVTAYFSVQRDIGPPPEASDIDASAEDSLALLRELQHRVKNHLGLVVSMIRVQASRKVTPDSLRAVGRRVEALALLYEELFAASTRTGPGELMHVGGYLSRIVAVVTGLEGGSAIRVNVDCDEVDLPVDQAARLGLLLSELLTNALEHAFAGRDRGSVSVEFHELPEGGVRLVVADDGIGLPEGSNWPFDARSVAAQREQAKSEGGTLDTTGHHGHSGVGGSIITALTQTLGASLDVQSGEGGTRVTVDFVPAE